MNRPKLHLIRIFVLALLFSMLVAPVSAAAPETSSHRSHGLSSGESQESSLFRFPTISQLYQSVSDLPRATYSEFVHSSISIGDTKPKSFSFSQNCIIYHVPVDHEYTITNTGSEDLTLSLVTVRFESASEIRTKYSDYIPEKFPKDDTQVHFAVRTVKTSWFLTNENVFKDGFSSEQDAGIRRIHPGETVTFTLPEAEEGQHYRLFVTPEKLPLTMTFDFLISNTAELPPAPSAFSDVPDTAYFAAPVAWAVEKKITTGTTETTFSPNDTCTKAQILTFLWRAKGQIEPAIDNPFSDVTEENYYYKAALWAYENGLVEGDIFDGAVPCTRAMTVTYLWALAGRPAAGTACTFTDVDSGAEYAQAVAWCVEQEITTGTGDTTFSPDNICTRAQIVTLLYRALEK